MRERDIKKILLWISSIFILVFCLAPFVFMGIVSFSKNPDFLLPSSSFIFTFSNYIDILKNNSTHILQYLTNSVVIAFLSALFATFFSSLSAYSITRMKFPGRKAIPITLLAFSMFPQISIVGYLFKIMTSLDWVNTYQALIFPYITLGLPLALWIMLSYFSQLSQDLDNAALVDGASRTQILTRIILPISLPGLFSTFVLVFIYSFNEFLFALMLTVDYKARTIPVGLALFEGLHGQIPWGYIMAAAVISIIPIVVLIAIFQKYIIQGLSEGALKG